MRYVWDKTKCQANIKKHGIDFHDVPAVFHMPMVTFMDTRKHYGEDRWIGIGLLHSIVVTIAFTEPDDDTIRIISARKATKNEKETYVKQI